MGGGLGRWGTGTERVRGDGRWGNAPIPQPSTHPTRSAAPRPASPHPLLHHTSHNIRRSGGEVAERHPHQHPPRRTPAHHKQTQNSQRWCHCASIATQALCVTWHWTVQTEHKHRFNSALNFFASQKAGLALECKFPRRSSASLMTASATACRFLCRLAMSLLEAHYNA